MVGVESVILQYGGDVPGALLILYKVEFSKFVQSRTKVVILSRRRSTTTSPFNFRKRRKSVEDYAVLHGRSVDPSPSNDRLLSAETQMVGG